jgi:hypothetical protein
MSFIIRLVVDAIALDEDHCDDACPFIGSLAPPDEHVEYCEIYGTALRDRDHTVNKRLRCDKCKLGIRIATAP